jgi:hypothetical protein
MSPLEGLFPLILGVSHFIIFVESQYQPRPIAGPIQDVSLPNRAFVRGISMTVGSNNQNISFFASG